MLATAYSLRTIAEAKYSENQGETRMTSRIEAYRVHATTRRNFENKMHDDTVAKRFRFRRGGLFPCDVMAYMIHSGRQMGPRVSRARVYEARFVKPVYEGRRRRQGEESDGVLSIETVSRASSAPPAMRHCPPQHDVSISDFAKPLRWPSAGRSMRRHMHSANGLAPFARLAARRQRNI